MADQTAAIDAAPARRSSSTFLQIAVLATLAATGTLATNILLPSLPQMAASLKVSTAAVTAAITVFLAVFALGQLAVGPISDRYGRRWPVLAGFVVFFAGSIWCGLATDLPGLLVGRVIQAAGACSTSVLSRAIARDLFSGAALGRAMALIMIAMAAAPGFSPLLGGALDHDFRLALGIRLCRVFAAVGALAYGAVLGETHHATRTPLDPLAIAKNYLGLIGDRRFVVPAATVSLIMGGLFAIFSCRAPRTDRGHALYADPARPVLRRHRADGVFRRHARDQTGTTLGLDRAIQIGLFAPPPAASSILLVSLFNARFLPFLAGMCVFLLGMGIVNPLGTAQALSPFGEKAGAASALVGFWQMMSAAIARLARRDGLA